MSGSWGGVGDGGGGEGGGGGYLQKEIYSKEVVT
jgi:hypothetical protein